MGNYLSSSKCYPLNGEFCAGNDDDSESDLDLMDYRSLKSVEGELSDDSKSPKSMTTDVITPRDDEMYDAVTPMNTEEIFHEFRNSVISKDFLNAMAIMDEYKNVNFFDHYFPNGDTCLHYAVRLHKAKFLYFLLQKGMNPNCQNKLTHDTPLHIATKREKTRMIVILMKFNADIHQKNILGKTPVDIAKSKNDEDLLNLFDEDLQTFLHMKEPTYRDYRAIQKPEFGGHNGASNHLLSAWQYSVSMRQTPKDLSYEWQSPRKNHWYSPKVTPNNKSDNPLGNILFSVSNRKLNLIGAESNLMPIPDNECEYNDDDNMNNVDLLPQINFNKNSNKIQYSNVNEFNVNDTSNDNDNNDGKDQLGQQQTLKSFDIDTALKRVGSLNTAIGTYVPSVSISNARRLSLTLTRVSNDLPLLGDWLQRLRTEIYPKMYLKRFIFIQDQHLCWNEKKVKFNPNDKITQIQRNKYNRCISLLLIKNVTKYKSKKKNVWKFQITCYNTKRTRKKRKNKDKLYLWKCYSKEQRNKWVDGLNIHCASLNDVISQLSDGNNE